MLHLHSQRRLCLAFVAALFVTLNAATMGQAIKGRVVGVHDGDSITVLAPGNVEVKTRLEGIDAPELKQPHGQASKQALSALVFGKGVVLHVTGKDRYRRTLARVLVGGVDVNAALVRAGWAWRYKKYSKDPALIAAQDAARSEGLGLWASPGPVPPWDWRKKK